MDRDRFPGNSRDARSTGNRSARPASKFRCRGLSRTIIWLLTVTLCVFIGLSRQASASIGVLPAQLQAQAINGNRGLIKWNRAARPRIKQIPIWGEVCFVRLRVFVADTCGQGEDEEFRFFRAPFDSQTIRCCNHVGGVESFIRQDHVSDRNEVKSDMLSLRLLDLVPSFLQQLPMYGLFFAQSFISITGIDGAGKVFLFVSDVGDNHIPIWSEPDWNDDGIKCRVKSWEWPIFLIT